MSHEARTVLFCDTRTRNCLRSFEAVGGLNLTRALAREHGWVFRREGRDSCPGCELAR